MPAHPLAPAEALRRVELIEQLLREGHPPPGYPAPNGAKGAVYEAAARLGKKFCASKEAISRIEASAGRAINWKLYRPFSGPRDDAPRFIPPLLPAEDMPVEDLIASLEQSFKRRSEHAAAKKWMRFTLTEPGPYILAFVGDPHVDDNGCNWPLLKRDLDLMRQPHVHGVCLGDVTNNWSGKLQRLYAHQDVTRDRAWKLAQHFFSTVPWLMLIKGNHDIWSQSHGQGDPLDWMQRGAALLEDWSAKFEVATPDGHAVKVWAAHDFKGTSLYNPLHGPMRAQRFSAGEADVLVGGHQHHWELFQGEDADKGRAPYWLARARGYKFIDPHADHHQYASQQHGATIAALVDPTREGPAAVQCYADLAEAVEILEFKRERWTRCQSDAPDTTTQTGRKPRRT